MATSSVRTDAFPRSYSPHRKRVLRSPFFYAVMFQFVVIEAVGSGFFIGNLKLLAGSCGFPLHQRDLLVSYFSLSNCAGRVVFGYLSDVSCLHKAGWFMLFPLLMLVPLTPLLMGGSSLGGEGAEIEEDNYSPFCALAARTCSGG